MNSRDQSDFGSFVGSGDLPPEKAAPPSKADVSDEVETRWYIGMSPMGRVGIVVGPGRFGSLPTDPMPADGTWMYPVSQAVHDAFMTEDDDEQETAG